MRVIFPLLALSAALVAAPLAVSAAPAPIVHVSIGPELQKKAHEYGQRDLDQLAQDLRRDVQNALARSRHPEIAYAEVDLVITDARPNRPTFEQLSRNPGLSMRSISLGGASITGYAVPVNGPRLPVKGGYWGDNLRDERGAVTWTDADTAFQMFARDLANGRR